MITELGPDMDSTKKELENINAQKGSLTAPVDEMVKKLDDTRTVSALSPHNRLSNSDKQANTTLLIKVMFNGNVGHKMASITTYR